MVDILVDHKKVPYLFHLTNKEALKDLAAVVIV